MRITTPTLTSLILVLPLLAGCTSPTQSSVDPLGAAPQDFGIDMTILVGDSVEPRPQAHLRPGRFVLFADGSLHYGPGDERGAGWLPGRTRVLSRRQVAELWSLAQQVGFADPAAGADPVNLSLIQPPPDGLAYLISFVGRGDHWMHVRTSTIGNPDAACVRLARLLADLAWTTDLPEDQIAVIPRRYDLGPDPYIRYRQP